MKTIITLILLFLFSLNTFAQDYAQWSLPEGAKMRLGKGRLSGNIAYSPDGTRLAVASSIGIWLYDTATHQEVALLTGHNLWGWSVAFSPDGQTIASASFDNTVRLWDAHTGQQKQTLKGHTYAVYSVAFSPDGQTIASGGTNTVRLWDVHTGQQKQTLKGHMDRVYSVAFSPDGQTIASASFDNTVRLWDAHTGQQKQTLKGHTYAVYSVAFSPDGQTIASGSYDRTVRLWDVHTGQQKQTLGHTPRVISIAFSPDGQTIASVSRAHASWSDEVRLWDVHTGQQKQTLKGYTKRVHSVAFSPDGQTLTSVSGDGTVWLWDVHTGKHKQTLKDHVNSIAFSPDGQTIASASGDGTILLWDVHTGQQKQTLKGHVNAVESVAFSPDRQTLASASLDGTILLWDITEPPVDISVPLGFAVEKWSSLEPVAMEFIANPEYGTGIMGATIRNAAFDDGEVLLWRYSAGGEELVARIPAKLVNAVPTVRFDQTGLFDNKLFVAISAGPVGGHTTRIAIVEPNGQFRDAISIDDGNTTRASIEFSSQPSYPAGAYIYDADSGELARRAQIVLLRGNSAYIHDADNGERGQSFYRLDESFNLHRIASHTIPSGRSDIDPIDLKFDPTGKYGGLLTLSDTDLNHDELSGLYQLQADGAWRTLVTPAPVGEHQFQGIAFSNAGPLGSALYVADAVTDNIWVVTPKGVLEAFAVGFTNPQRVVIGPEGTDMWVADQTGLYRIFSTDPADWEAAKATLPVASSLEPNYPNPFNSSTQIPYRVSALGPVRLVIYNALGQPVRTLVDAIQAAGAYQVPWDGRDHRGAHVANGVYLYRLQAGTAAQVRKMLVLE